MGYRRICGFAALNLALVGAVAYGVQRSDGIEAPAPAQGAWVKVSENKAFVLYVDPVHTGRNATLRRVWELFDLKNAHQGEASLKSLDEYDCTTQRYRILSASGHSGPMGTGAVLWNMQHAGRWVVPGEQLLNLMCPPRDAQWVRIEEAGHPAA